MQLCSDSFRQGFNQLPTSLQLATQQVQLHTVQPSPILGHNYLTFDSPSNVNGLGPILDSKEVKEVLRPPTSDYNRHQWPRPYNTNLECYPLSQWEPTLDRQLELTLGYRSNKPCNLDWLTPATQIGYKQCRQVYQAITKVWSMRDITVWSMLCNKSAIW